jgi:hypothetical protein
VCGSVEPQDAEGCVSRLSFPSTRLHSLILRRADPSPSSRTGPGFGEFTNDQETVFERIARGPEGKTSAVVDHGAPGQWHGAKAKTAIACTNDEEVNHVFLHAD